MRKCAWVLIGDANTKKSSVVRGLTGIGKSQTLVEVQEISGLRIKLKSFLTSLQENEIDEDKMIDEIYGEYGDRADIFSSVSGLDRDDDGGGYTNYPIIYQKNALVTLRYDPVVHNGKIYNSGLLYVQRLVQESFEIKAIVSLGKIARPWIRCSGIPYASIVGVVDMPGSMVASQVRDFFGWR